MLVGMYVFPRFLVIKIFWRFFFLSWYIQTNQAYFTCLKTNNRDDYVSIYRLHGGSSVLLLNFVFSLPIYFIISLQHYICMINLVFGHVIIHVRIIFFVTASEVCKTPWEILQTPFFLRCNIHFNRTPGKWSSLHGFCSKMSPAHWKRKNRIMVQKISKGWLGERQRSVGWSANVEKERNKPIKAGSGPAEGEGVM